MNKIKRNILVACVLGCSTTLMAQQMPQYTQYLLNGYVINPAMAGTKPYFEGKLNHREQWMGITDAPRTNIISVNGPLRENMGVGGYIFNDINGPTRQFGFSGTYAYRIKLTDDIKLSMALDAGLMQFVIDGAKITTKNINDPVLTTGLQSAFLPNIGVSAYGYADKYFFGVSLSQITHSKIKYRELSTQATGRLVGHYFLMGGYNYKINDDFTLQPSCLVKYVSPVPVQAEITAKGIYKEMASLALSYRTSDAMTLTIGYTFQKYLSIGYSYDMLVSKLKNYSSGSHEIMLSVRFKGKDEKVAK